jgi:hypothetical protein
MEGSGRGLMQSTITAFAWKDWKTAKLLRITGLRVKI